MIHFFKKQKESPVKTSEEVGKIVLEAYKKAKNDGKFKSKLLIATKENEYKISMKIDPFFIFDPILVEKYLESVIFPATHYEVFVSPTQINIMKKQE
jgi:hypothetical protein